MKIEQRTIFIAKDGVEFNSQEECLAWENRKFRKSCKHLSNDEIIELLSIIHLKCTDKGVKIKIEIKDEVWEGNGFQYKITLETKEEKFQYNATITGDNDFRIFPSNQRSDVDCELDSYGFWLNDLLSFFKKVEYYKDLDVKPIINPDITEKWIEIKNTFL